MNFVKLKYLNSLEAFCDRNASDISHDVGLNNLKGGLLILILYTRSYKTPKPKWLLSQKQRSTKYSRQ